MIRVGTSGWQYDDWRGTFYPEHGPKSGWLPHYAERFATVEVNNTFYQLADPATFERWRDTVPKGFVFAVKANRFVTHVHRLGDAEESVARMLGNLRHLRDRLGPILFQLPPNLPLDLERLHAFLPLLPPGVRSAFEFRHRSWWCTPVFRELERVDAALVWADRPRARMHLVRTASFAYVRLHQGRPDAASYTARKLAIWANRLTELGSDDAYVYFNNDAGGAAPSDAARLVKRLAARGAPLPADSAKGRDDGSFDRTMDPLLAAAQEGGR
jgi:uncharacterized protein YecE (DUF72 family)